MNTEKLRKARDSITPSQKDFANMLNLSPARYNFYETGRTEPDNKTLIQIADAINVSIDYLLDRTNDPTPPNEKALEMSPKAHNIGLLYDRADTHLQAIVSLTLSPQIIETVPNVTDTSRDLLCYDMPSSAGSGQFLDSDDFTIIQASNFPTSTNFGVRISGDSMEPKYPDGHIACVQRKKSVENGQVGIFYLNGSGYIKKLSCKDGETKLISLNPAYEPIIVTESDYLHCFGLVVGVTSESD